MLNVKVNVNKKTNAAKIKRYIKAISVSCKYKFKLNVINKVWVLVKVKKPEGIVSIKVLKLKIIE